ncbi:MAG: hypothetical protein GKR92_11660 [Gammaproteobacteria bacterium]|nr:MAG: hypothetical protein GKR92_11660 [Gammaproteobacteria bacterium]
MTHVKYFRISLLFPIVVGATLAALIFLFEKSFFKSDLQPYLAIAAIGHLYAAAPYIIFAIIIAILIKGWSSKRIIVLLLLTPILFLIVPLGMDILLGLKGLIWIALVATLICGYIYVVLILGGYFIGRSYGWIEING